MRPLLFFLSLLAPFLAEAVERRVNVSPSNRYEVFLVAESADIPAGVEIRDTKTRRRMTLPATETWWPFKSASLDVVWRMDEKFVAFGYKDGKWIYGTELFHLERGRLTSVTIPAFIGNILGRQGAIERGKNLSVSFDKFLPNDRCLLVASVDPSLSVTEPPEPFDPDDSFRPTNHSTFDIEIQLARSSDLSAATLLSIKVHKGEPR